MLQLDIKMDIKEDGVELSEYLEGIYRATV